MTFLQGDLHFAGDGRTDDPDAVGRDLALLSACNHTVLSHGSFSYFGGALAGGLKVVPEHFAEYRNAETDYEEFAVADPLDTREAGGAALPRFHFVGEMTRRRRKKGRGGEV